MDTTKDFKGYIVTNNYGMAYTRNGKVCWSYKPKTFKSFAAAEEKARHLTNSSRGCCTFSVKEFYVDSSRLAK